ncbi:N-acetylmuramoyl-L-alanine amidase [bacterium]|nr:N-acetylmuramoyl-L-alanine amidase [candidate division CSSED10-310 bacterium]
MNAAGCLSLRRQITVFGHLLAVLNLVSPSYSNSITITAIASNASHEIPVVKENGTDYLILPDLLQYLDIEWEWDYLHGIIHIHHRDHMVRVAEGVAGGLVDGNLVDFSASNIQRDNQFFVPVDFIPEILMSVGEGNFAWESDGYRILDLSGEVSGIAPGIHEQLVVVIDPGHGGEDNGMWLASGIWEKQVTFHLADRLASILRTRLGVSVEMTRSGDETVSIEQRKVVANASKADLFIGIHLGSDQDLAGNGFNIYVSGTAVTPDDPGSRLFYWEETPASVQAESLQHARGIGNALAETAPGTKWSIKQLNLKILKGLAIPGCIIELNEKMTFYGDLDLSRGAGLRRTSEALFDAIKISLIAKRSDE